MDALPRIIDTNSTLGVDASTIAIKSSTEFLSRYPQLHQFLSDEAISCIEKYAERHVEHLGIAIERNNSQIIQDYFSWVARVLVSRNVKIEHIVEHVEILRDFLEQALPNELKQQGCHYLNTAIQAIQLNNIEDKDSFYANDHVGVIAQEYLHTLLKQNRKDALTCIEEALRQGITAQNLYLNVFQPTMYEIGRLWETSVISVAQEHIATAMTQYVMAHTYPHLLVASDQNAGHFAITGVAGELHEIGMRMVADFLEASHWNVDYLGTNLPPESIVETLENKPPDIIGISICMSFNLNAAEKLIQRIKDSSVLNETKIIVGGCAVKHGENLWKEIGADAFGNDAKDAIEVIESLM